MKAIFMFYIFGCFGQPDTQPPSQPAWLQRSWLGQARFSNTVLNLHSKPNQRSEPTNGPSLLIFSYLVL